MSSISFFNADVALKIINKKALQAFILSIVQEEGKSITSATIIFCSDTYLLTLNRQFLNHDFYTDILTFDLSVNDSISGEIYVSVDRVKENAAMLDIPFSQELNRIIFHGILHLCGYKDKVKKDKVRMTQKENEYLEKYSSFHVKQPN